MADLMQQARELANACEQRAQWGRGSAWSPPRDSVGTSRLLDEAASLMRELAALRAAPEGYVLVPVEATEKMVRAALPHHWPYLGDEMREKYRRMLAARPQGVK